MDFTYEELLHLRRMVNDRVDEQVRRRDKYIRWMERDNAFIAKVAFVSADIDVMTDILSKIDRDIARFMLL